MKIYSDETKKNEINSLSEWFKLCPPKGGEKQWIDYHSAKEMANFWAGQNRKVNYENFQNFLQKKIKDFDYNYIIPEYKSKFDDYRNPRKHDLFITEKNHKAIITIEGKAAESFGGKEFGIHFVETVLQKIENHKSKELDRMIELYIDYFKSKDDIFSIIYQILYWFAGSVCDAIKDGTDNVVMVLQEFKSNQINSKKQQKNKRDFEKFINFISEGKYKDIEEEDIIGPITNEYTSIAGKGKKNLYIGYYSTKLDA